MLITSLNVANSMSQWVPNKRVNIGEGTSSAGTRSIFISPVEVYTTLEGFLVIDVLEPMGNITVKVTKLGQVKYQQTMALNAPTQITINIGDYAPGNYMIEFIYPSGRTLSGEFAVD